MSCDPTDGSGVLICVITYNSASVLPGLLESLEKGLGDVPWRLAVADNDSADDSVALASALVPSATIVQTGRNAGYAAGLNAAVAAALEDEQAILVVNPDVRLGPDCVPRLLSALRDDDVGIAVPRLEDRNGRLIYSMRREPTLLRAIVDATIGATRGGRIPKLGEVVSDDSLYTRPTTIDWAEGSTQLISADCWHACGPWDESFFLYSEETEFALRARDRGYVTRYVPYAHAVHLEGDSGASPKLWPLVVVNRLRLYRRRHGPLRAILFWGALVLREGSRSLLGRATSRSAVRVLLSPTLLRREASAEWLQ